MNHPDQAGLPLADLGAVFRTSSPTAPQPARRAWANRWLVWGLLLIVALGGGSVAWGSRRSNFWRRDDPVLAMPRAAVTRVDLSTVLTASGRVESSHNTIIACELERLEFRAAGQTIMSGGASTILWLIDEGSTVKKGDILCRLDGSDYEELVRQQQIKAEQARAILQTGRLNLEVAELAVREYREGLIKQEMKTLEGSIALAESNLERSADRLRWTQMMLGKGYVARMAKATAVRDEKVASLDLLSSQWELRNLKMFGIPTMLRKLESEVEKRRYEVTANTQRMTRTEERLHHYELMVARCTIRAPHDGFVIYATDPFRRDIPRIEQGTTVRQAQQLFFLPDLGHMQVSTNLHESVARNVKPGMHARVRIEGLPDRTFEGQVISVAPLPSAPNWFSDEVKYFVGIVRLDSAPQGILPAMTAEVEVDVDSRPDVLAVPNEAIAIEDGHDICYVAGPDGLRRQEVTIGRSGRALLEVTKGLIEGDQVLLNPSKIEAIESMVLNPTHETQTDDFAPSESAPVSSPISVE